MAKVKGPKTRPKPKQRLSDKDQSERFIDAARALGVEETGEHFNRHFNKVVKPPSVVNQTAARKSAIGLKDA